MQRICFLARLIFMYVMKWKILTWLGQLDYEGFFFFFFFKRNSFIFILFIYLFIFGCVGSSFLCKGFL